MAAAGRQPERSAQLLAAAQEALEEMRSPLSAVNRAEYDRILARTQNDLDGAAFHAIWEDGRRMPLEEAVARALGESA